MSKHHKHDLIEDLRLYKRLFINYIFPHWLAFTIAILGSVAFSSIDAGVTYLFKPLLDKGFIAREAWFIRWAPLLIFLGFVLRGGAHFVSSYFMTWVSRSVVMVFRQQIFQHLLHLSASFYDSNSSGRLLSKLLYDVEQIAKISTDSITDLVQAVSLIIGLIVVMLVISWKLTLLYLVTAPLIAIIIRYSSLRIRRISRSVQRTMGSVTEIAQESIEGYKVVKIFSGQDYETEKFNHSSAESRQRDMKVEITKSFSVSGVQLIAACGISLIVYLAISPNSAMLLSAGGFVSMIVAMLTLLKPMKTLTTVNVVIQRGLAGAQSVFALLDEPIETDRGVKIISRTRGEIIYKQINFNYRTDNKVILKNVNLHIKPGETVAFVGRSGAGKSTLVSLLPRFYEPTAGTIYLDGHDIKTLTLRSLRQQIALVSQNVTLFNDTVAHNIAYGCYKSVSEADILRAAEAAYAMEFINNLPQGLNTIVGDNGVLLSGGQRQRIAMARALLKNAPVLILDEATSALDTESERYIQAALEVLIRDRTTLVIAHRLSTIERADNIVVMDNGEIVEQGTHQELLNLGKQYAYLYDLQFKNGNKLKHHDKADIN